MTRRLIGTGTTDSQGKVTVPYTGTGAGKLQIIAETDEIESNPIELYDCLLKDNATSNDYTDLFQDMNLFTREANGTTVYYDNSAGSTNFQTRFNDFVSMNEGDIAIDCEIIDCSFVNVQTGRYTQAGTNPQYENVNITSTGSLHIELKNDGTYFYLENTLIKSDNTETNNYTCALFFRATTGNIMNFKYRDLKVYPI